MSRPKNKLSAARIDQMLGEASWLLSHAQALADYGRPEEAAAERARAAAIDTCRRNGAACSTHLGRRLHG